jgi:DNA-binding NarL/FixJ family response regulator
LLQGIILNAHQTNMHREIADITKQKSERLVLLVCSNAAEIKLWQHAIAAQSHLYSVIESDSAAKAMKIFAENSFDVVAMDFDLPDMPADKLLAQLHQEKPCCPIIVMTEIDDPDLALKVLQAGASDFLPKIGAYYKFLPRTLTTNIQRALLLENLQDMNQRFEQSSKDEALLNRLIVNIHSSLNLEEITDKAAQSLLTEFNASRVIICTNIESDKDIRIDRQITLPSLEGISDKSAIFSLYRKLLIENGEHRPLVMMHDDTFASAQDVKRELLNNNIKSMIMVPLIYRGRLMGLLHLDACQEIRLWTQSEINLLVRIANQLSIALSQAKLHSLIENQSRSIDKLTDLCGQLNSVVHSTRELTQRQELTEKVRVKLSPREIEVLRKVAQGLPNREIAGSLHITEGTAEVHVSRLRKKLNLSSRAALVRYAYENHLS